MRRRRDSVGSGLSKVQRYVIWYEFPFRHLDRAVEFFACDGCLWVLKQESGKILKVTTVCIQFLLVREIIAHELVNCEDGNLCAPEFCFDQCSYGSG